MLAGLENRSGPGRRAAGRALWPSETLADVLVTPLVAGGERVGVLCVATTTSRAFGDEDAEISRAIAHLAAVAIKRAELIEGLTKANTIKDLFEALAAGATTFAAAKAAEVRCDLNAPYLILSAQPAGCPRPVHGRVAGGGRGGGPRAGRARAALGDRVRARPGAGAAGLRLGAPQRRRGAAARGAGAGSGATARSIGVSELRDAPDDAPGAYREARDAATIAHALLRDGGAIAYSQVGAYRYLVQIGADDAPRDRMRAAVDLLIDYDRRRRTALLDTLERYLSERRSVIESARALYIHPNTLRQRLGRIEELTGLDLDDDDLLSLELAIKLARLHGRPDARLNPDSSGTRYTGSLALRRTRWGSWVHIMLPVNRLRSGSAAITIASQLFLVGLGQDLLGGVAGAEHVPVGLQALALEPPDRLGDDVALLGPLLLGRQQPGRRHAERGAVDPGDREHVHARARRLGQLDRPGDRRRRDRPALGGQQDPPEGSRDRVWAPPPARWRSIAGSGDARLGGCHRLRGCATWVLDPLAIPVQRQVEQEHAPADEVEGQRLGAGGVAGARGVDRARRRSR